MLSESYNGIKPYHYLEIVPHLVELAGLEPTNLRMQSARFTI